METNTVIKCPRCDFELDVNSILSKQLEDELKKKFNEQLATEKQKFEEATQKINAEKATLDEQRKKMEEQIREGGTKK